VKFKTNKEEQYKVIQNFQVPQKEQSNCCKFSSAILTKKKNYKLNSSKAKLSKPQHSTAPHSTAQLHTAQNSLERRHRQNAAATNFKRRTCKHSF
jgi:hypothetical protein